MTLYEQMLSEALGLYGLKQPQVELIRHNENMTYKINEANKKYVLRIHKRIDGFSTDLHDMKLNHIELVQGELDIISALKNGTDIRMQTLVYGLNGNPVQILSNGIPATLLEWVEGQTVESIGMTPEILKNSGKLMAKMHSFFLQQNKIEKQYFTIQLRPNNINTHIR